MRPAQPGHPGALIRTWLAGREGRRTQARLAEDLGISQKHLSQLVTGRVGLSPAIALRLETATGIRAEVWLALDSGCKLAELRAAAEHPPSATP